MPTETKRSKKAYKCTECNSVYDDWQDAYDCEQSCQRQKAIAACQHEMEYDGDDYGGSISRSCRRCGFCEYYELTVEDLKRFAAIFWDAEHVQQTRKS